MKTAILSSGSRGNCTLIQTNNTKILIDLGVTKSYVEEKLEELEVDPKEIKAILITHTHVDHIQGLKVFLKKYNPNCIFCGSSKDLISYNDSLICTKCKNRIAHLGEEML